MCVQLYFYSNVALMYMLQVSVDNAMNVPWSGYTFASFCLNPPGAFYKVIIIAISTILYFIYWHL